MSAGSDDPARTLVLRLVVVAGFVRDAVGVGILPHPRVVTPMAGARIAAVDDVLDGEVGGRPGSFPLDVYPV